MADLEHELDQLYGLPLEQFTVARNDLAARLKKAGDASAAAEVKGLKKPSAAVWLLNQLARQEPRLVEQLLAAGDDLRRAQEQALAAGDADELRRATSAEREAVRELVRAARDMAEASGRTISSDTLERVRTSLSAVAGDEEAGTLLRLGRVTREFERVGFPALIVSPTPTRKRARAARPAKAERRSGDELAELRARREEQRKQIQALRARVGELRREAGRAQAQERRAESAAVRARRQAEDAERAQDEAAREAARLGSEVERAEAELAEAEAAAGRPGRAPGSHA